MANMSLMAYMLLTFPNLVLFIIVLLITLKNMILITWIRFWELTASYSLLQLQTMLFLSIMDRHIL